MTAPAAPDSAGEPPVGAENRPEPEQAPTLTGGAAQNVVMVQTSGSTWDVRVSGSHDVVGTISKADEHYTAIRSGGAELGPFDSPELAMFGLIAAG